MSARSMSSHRAAAAPATRPLAVGGAGVPRLLPWLAAVLLAAGCASAPELPRNRPPLGADFANASSTPAEPEAEFWRAFNDRELDALVNEALRANAQLRIASATLQEARALAGVADAQLGPSVGLNSNVGRIRERDAFGVVQNYTGYAVGFDVAWEADLFGRVRNDRRAAWADVLASEAQVRAAQVSVAAEVARNYFAFRGLQEQLRVATAALETQREALKLVQARQSVGRGTAFDTERARALVESTAATLPALEATLIATRYRLAVLSGRAPTALDAVLVEQKPLPALQAIELGQIGSPETLLRRRPDVAAAEQQVEAAAARVGVARSALFPRVTLGGTIGLNSTRFADLTDSVSFAYNLGASLAWSLIDFGRNRQLIAAASARGEAAVVSYENVVLTALEETEGALARYTRTQRQTERLYDAAQAAGKAAEIARARFDAGAVDFLAVLDAERERLSASDQLAQAQTAAATSVVAVYKALAGGWQP